ncbi:ankyrin-3 isoform X3 [Folsomia candida]|uniref:ankyrin-3 isoform X3 n=1 Tax=Folsomia candida TaxID=158441 RepID=UPI001604C2BB|nr:ankyrin-3 isoform X3 [Folsomia candida]
MFKKFASISSLGSEPGTGLLRAARAGNLEKVLEFLKGGVDINTCNANGLNGLHLASKDGHVSVVRELLERKANVNATTKKGNAAIHIASLAGQEEVVRILIEHGASVNLQSTNGFTPLYMASQENHDGIVKLLLANGANQSLATEDMFTPLAVAMQQGHDKVVAILLESDVRGKVRLPALHIAAKKDDCKAAALLLQSSANPDVTSKSMFTPLHIASHYGNLAVATLLLDRGADVNFQAKHNITPLHVAAKWGKAQVCALLLDRGGSIEAKTRDGLTPLHCAARSGHEQVVDLLLERQAPISSKTKNGIVPLAMCAQGDHVDAARILLYHKAPVDDVTVDYLTSLHVAAHCGHVRIAKLLLDRKADPNARALNGFTPLHIACKKNRIKVVELLLKNGAHIEAATESGLTPLHVSAFMGSMNIAIFLLQNEAKPDATTVRGETPLHLAARANQTDIVRILLRNNANVDSAAKEGQTPLHIASRLGNADLVMLLLQSGATVDAPTKEMYTALHVAAKAGQEEVAAILLDKGADVAARTSRGWTPLHLAGKYNTGNTKVANLLISRGAPVNAEGKNQLTPLHTSCHHKNNEVALLLLNNEADPKCLAKNNYSPLHIAAKQNQIDIATALLEYGAEVNGQSRQGYTPIHLAADQGNTDMVALLIQHGGDANAGAKNQLRPLHLAAQNDHVRSASVLVSSGNAEIDPQTQSGYSPLHVASHFGQAGMVRYLLQNGANVHLTTEAGNTALHHAAQQGQTLIITLLLEKKADPDVVNNSGQNPLAIAEKLGYVSVVETLKIVTTTITTTTTTTTTIEERYKVLAPESMNENLASDSEDEGAEDAANEAYRYLTVDDMKSLGDDSMPIDVTRDEQPHRDSGYLHGDDKYENIVTQKYTQLAADNVDISRTPIQIGTPISAVSLRSLTSTPTTRYSLNFNVSRNSTATLGMCRDSFLVSFMVDARGGAMRGCRHSGVRVIIPPRKAASPMRITCRYLKKDRLVHPPPLMEGEALASRILELGPAAAKFLGPVILEVPHFASLRGHEREIVILRSDNGETWREHNLDATEEAVQDVLNESFDANDLKQLEDLKTNRITRILTTDFPQYFALVSRIRQEVHAVGPEGGMVSSTVVPQVQAVFPQGALTKRIKVGLQAQPIHIDLVNKVAGSRVSVSPIVTVEPRRRKFHKPITLTIPKPKSQDPNCVLRLLCSITGGTTRAQWEDVTGSTPLSIVNDCISFTTTVSARFWLIDCRHASHDVTRMATDLYREVIHVPFMAKFVIFAKRIELTEARLRVFCMTDDREEKTLEGQEHFTEVAKSRDVEVLEGKQQWIEMAGNLAPVTKSGEQLRLKFIAFRENRLPFLVRLRDVNADAVGRIIFMRDSKSSQKGDQAPVCNLNIVLPDQIMPDEPSLPPSISSSPRLPLHTNRYNIKNVAYSSTPRHGVLSVGEIHRGDLKISDVANLLDDDWIPLARNLGITDPDITIIEAEYPQSPHQQFPSQATVMLRLWMQQAGDRATGNTLEKALDSIGRGDIIKHCIGNIAPVTDASEKLLAQSQVALESQIIQPQTKQDRRNLSLDDEQDLMKDSESLEDLSQTDAFRNKQAKRRSMTPTDEEGGPNVMTSSYERDEQKYSAEEKESRPEEKVSAKERELSAQAPPRTQEEEPEYEPVGQSSWSQEEQEQEQAPVGEGSSSKSKVAEDISSSPSRVVENIGTFRDRKAFWEEKDEEEKKKRESVSSVEDYTQGIENTAFIGQEVIDKSGHVLEQPSAKLRTPSPYEIERSKEAIFLDTDEEELRQKTDMTTERKVLFKGDEQSVSVEEQLTSISSSVSGRDSVDKSEIETSEKGPQQGHSDNSLKEARTAATNLVTEIESKVGQQFGLGDVVGESSMDITDEELLSTGELSSPETQRSTKAQSSSAQQQQAQQHPELDTTTLEGSGTGPYDTFAVKSSSSGEFFTAPEDSTLKSSSDDPSRPKSWDSSILGQVSGGSNSEYQTALSAGSGASSSESYLGSLSSDASQSETLVASQISLARDQDRDFLLDDDDNSASVQSPPPPLPPRDHPRPAEPQVTQSPSKASQVGQRSVHCEAGPSGGESGSGYPVTLTSSTSGTTVCTQVETSGTFKCEVKGEATREDDQEGNIMVLEHHHHRPLARRSVSMSDADPSALEPPKKTHRRSESQSWSDSLMYGVEEQIREEVIEEEISDLFSRGGSFQQRSIDDDPIERPITPEPGFSPLERKIGYYPGSSFDIELNRQEMGEDEEEEDEILDYPRSIDPRESIFDRMVPSSRLEDIEEEGSLKNSPKSVLSLEMSATSIVEFDHDKGSLEGSGSGGTGTSSSNGRPGSRESSSSLNEFERLESAVLDEEVKVDLSEIEEGHESQVSESDDQETELYEQDSYCDNDPDLMSEADDKMMKIFSERIDIPTDSESSNSNSNKSSSRIPRKSDPIAFFTTTLDPRSPSIEETDTNTSQFDEYHLDPRSELVGGSTDADSSLEFQHQFTKQRISRGMTSSGDSLDEPVSASTSRGGGRDDDAHTPQNLMEISRDSLDLEKESSSKRSSDSPPPADHKMVTSTDSLQLQAQMSSSFSSHPAAPMTDSFTNNVMQTSSRSNVMTDSLEMEGGVKMSESVDSLNGGNLTSTATERSLSTVAAAATMATSTTSTDSLEGGPGVAEHGLSSSSSTAADAAMWSSTSGSVSTLMSSQEDLTLEGTTQS